MSGKIPQTGGVFFASSGTGERMHTVSMEAHKLAANSQLGVGPPNALEDALALEAAEGSARPGWRRIETGLRLTTSSSPSRACSVQACRGRDAVTPPDLSQEAEETPHQ
jgi:hypothetical protein